MAPLALLLATALHAADLAGGDPPRFEVEARVVALEPAGRFAVSATVRRFAQPGAAAPALAAARGPACATAGDAVFGDGFESP